VYCNGAFEAGDILNLRFIIVLLFCVIPFQGLLAESNVDVRLKILPIKFDHPVDVVSLKGERVAFESLIEDRPTLVNLWATWCGPCVRELPSLSKLSKSDIDLSVLLISQDKGGFKKPKQFLEQYDIETSLGFVDSRAKLSKAYSVIGLPTTIIFNKKQSVMAIYEGEADWASPQLINRLKIFIKTGG
jgi:thiol-disulfide isomerase/thioredoxin